MKKQFLTLVLLLVGVAGFAQTNVAEVLNDMRFRKQLKAEDRATFSSCNGMVSTKNTVFNVKVRKSEMPPTDLLRIKKAFAADAVQATEQSLFSDKSIDSTICILVFGGKIPEAISALSNNKPAQNGGYHFRPSKIDGAAMMAENSDSLWLNVYVVEKKDVFMMRNNVACITEMMEQLRAEGKATYSPVKYLQPSKKLEDGIIRNTGIHVLTGPEMSFEVSPIQMSEAQLQAAFGHKVNPDSIVILPPGKSFEQLYLEMAEQYGADSKFVSSPVKQQKSSATTSSSVSGNFRSPVQVDVSAVEIPGTHSAEELPQVRVISEQEYLERQKDFERERRGVADSTYMGFGVSVGKYYEVKDSAEAKRVFDIWAQGIPALFNDAELFIVDKTDSAVFVSSMVFATHCALELNADHSLSFMCLEPARTPGILYIPPVGDLHKYHYSFKGQLYEQVPPEVVALMNADIAKRDAELAAQYQKESGSKGRPVAVAGKPLSADEIRRIAIESGDQRLIEQVASHGDAASAASNGVGRRTNMQARDAIFAFVNDEPAGYVTPSDLENIETLAARLSIHKDNIKSYTFQRTPDAVRSHKDAVPADVTAVAEITTNLPSWLKKRTTPEQYKKVERLNSRYIIDFEKEKMFQKPGTTPADVEHFYNTLERLIEDYDQQGHTGRIPMPSISTDYERQPLSITRTKKGTEVKVLVYSDQGGFDAHIIATLLVDMKKGKVLDCRYSTQSHACMDVEFEPYCDAPDTFTFGEGTDLVGGVSGTLSFVTPNGTKMTRAVCENYYVTLRKKGQPSIHPLFVVRVMAQPGVGGKAKLTGEAK